MSLPDFHLLQPRSIAEAAELLGRYPAEVKILAGGTDLIPSMRQKLFAPKYLLNIGGIADLRGIQETTNGVTIGALTPLSTVERSPIIGKKYPVLADAATTVASPIIRNMGTIGGNICLDTRCLWYNQSLSWRKSCGFCIKKDGDLCHVAPGGQKCWAAFSGDTPPALLCLDAMLEIAGPGGTRQVAMKDFYTNIGDARMKLEPNEILTKILLPSSTSGYTGVYKKLRTRGSIDYPLAGVAVAMKRSNGHIDDARVAITAVNPAPHLLKGVSQLVAGKTLTEDILEQIGEIAAKTAKPLTTSALTPEYRKEMIRVLTKRAVSAAGGLT